MRFFTVFLLILTLTNCASVNSKKANAKLQQTNSCCQNISELPFEKVEPLNFIEYDLAKASVFDFRQGKSYFIALEKPVESRFIEITSWLNGFLITNADLIYPLVTVLNKDKQIITTLRSLEDWRRGLSITPHVTRAPLYRIRLTLPEDTYFVVVHADPSKLTETTPYTHRPANGGLMFVDIGFNVIGNLTIGFN